MIVFIIIKKLILCNFGDRFFYSNFYEASNPIKLTQKLSYIVIEFFNYYLIQLFYKFFISKNNNEQYHLFNNIIKYLFIALICDSVLYFSFGINYPHLFVSLQFFSSFSSFSSPSPLLALSLNDSLL